MMIRTLARFTVLCFVAIAVPYTADAAPFAYITNSASNSVSVIDVATNTVIATIPVGSEPYGVAVSPDGARVYVTNFGSNDVSVISTATNTVTGTVMVGRKPRGVAVTPDSAHIYVGNRDDSTVSVISASTNTVTATITVGSSPSGVAVTPDGTRVYVTNQGGLTTLGTLSVIATTSNSVTATVTLASGVAAKSAPAGVAVTPDGTRVYVTNNGAGPAGVWVISTSSNTVTATVTGIVQAIGIAVTPDGARAYPTHIPTNAVSVISTATNTVAATVGVGGGPNGIDVTPDGARVYVANGTTNNVSVISTASNTVTATVAVGQGPVAFGKFIIPAPATPCPPDPRVPLGLTPISPPEFPYKVSFDRQCAESIAKLCVRWEIVRVCVGGNCFDPRPEPRPVCVRCALGASLAGGALLGGIGAMVFGRRRRP
jgi:YVTN family beta-propeller protein